MSNQAEVNENSGVNRRPVIFISGPMTGLPYFNRDAFNCAEKQLSDLDFIVLNPAVFPDGLQHGQYMVMTLAMLGQADAIYLLNGWEDSKGARAEALRARELGLMFYGESLEAVKGVMALPSRYRAVTSDRVRHGCLEYYGRLSSFPPFVTPESEVN
ncbi:DUF4406 domain-containing protein [Pantoea sp. BAV 3049]|uniref:DUF4406 domain-containing protein n=1 Tax=Pantoea sp. BAV 3049 TaxID=2654188 RepID=UPI00131B4B55|nr:DUF4406 domain-containing protein [Pantoea sp. BAV 3049]